MYDAARPRCSRPRCLPLCGSQVNEILSARLHARLNRDFAAADKMRDRLRREYGVEVYDQEREWRVQAADGGPGGASGAPTHDDGERGGGQPLRTGEERGGRYDRRERQDDDDERIDG